MKNAGEYFLKNKLDTVQGLICEWLGKEYLESLKTFSIAVSIFNCCHTFFAVVCKLRLVMNALCKFLGADQGPTIRAEFWADTETEAKSRC